MPANVRSAQINTSRLLRELWSGSAVSRIELASRLGFDKSTVTHITGRLLEAGIIHETGAVAGGAAGRKARCLAISADYAFVLGVEVLPAVLRYAVLDLSGVVRLRGDFPRAGRDTEGLNGDFSSMLQSLKASGIGVQRLRGITLAVSGLSDPARGVVIRSDVLKIHEELELTEMLQKPADSLLGPNGVAAGGMPLMLENDANCCAWGELTLRRGRSLENFLFLLLESELFGGQSDGEPRVSLGIGSCIDGRIHHGRGGSSGEFRSVFWKAGGNSQFSIPVVELKNMALDSALRARLFDEIASNIALILNVMSLDHVIIGGDIGDFWVELSERIRRKTHDSWPYTVPRRVSCTAAKYGAYAAACGAASMHLERIFAVKHWELFEGRQQPAGLESLGLT